MPSDPRDYKVTLSTGQAAPAREGAAVGKGTGRPSINVLFGCCNVYVRVYRSADGTHYLARCPKCAKSVRFAVRDEGTDARSFVVR